MIKKEMNKAKKISSEMEGKNRALDMASKAKQQAEAKANSEQSKATKLQQEMEAQQKVPAAAADAVHPYNHY